MSFWDSASSWLKYQQRSRSSRSISPKSWFLRRDESAVSVELFVASNRLLLPLDENPFRWRRVQ